MADSEDVLTQEQIDLMLSGGSTRRSVAAEPMDEEPKVNLTPTNLEQIRSGGGPKSAAAPLDSNQSPFPEAPELDDSAISDLVNRVANLEATVSQAEASGGDLQGILAQLQDLTSKVEGIMANMQGTVGYGARQTFVCSSCQNQGHVAAKLNCTVCGEENWWGWWPPQQ